MRIIFVLIFVFVFVFSNAVQAQKKGNNAVEALDRPLADETPATRIEVDEDANVVRFFIDGQERIVIDAAGLYVRGDIAYEGRLTAGLPAPIKTEQRHAD